LHRRIDWNSASNERSYDFEGGSLQPSIAVLSIIVRSHRALKYIHLEIH